MIFVATTNHEVENEAQTNEMIFNKIKFNNSLYQLHFLLKKITV